jgi:hypothetical protein
VRPSSRSSQASSDQAQRSTEPGPAQRPLVLHGYGVDMDRMRHCRMNEKTRLPNSLQPERHHLRSNQYHDVVGMTVH